MSLVYPPGQILRSGQQLALRNVDPHIAYIGHDGSIFHIAGPLAPTADAQNGVMMQDVKGLEAPVTHIASQGARQDGSTWQDAVYDPAEIDLTLETSAVSAKDHRNVIRAWLGAWSPKKTGILSWFTPEMGEWWCNVRQYKSIPDGLLTPWGRRQTFTWTAINNDAFWRTYDCVSSFGVTYTAAADNFERLDTNDWGNSWDLNFSENGTGIFAAIMDGRNAALFGNDSNPRTVVGRYKGFTLTTDNHILSMTFDGFPNWPLATGAANDLWSRMGVSGGHWDGNGVRLRISWPMLIISKFVNGVETVIASRPFLIPPFWGDNFTFQVGTEDDPREYRVLRGGFELMRVRENGGGSNVGVNYRNVGMGMRAGNGGAKPGAISKWWAGDNHTTTVQGFVPLTNLGDQDAWPRYLCYGPGTFSFGDGPSSRNFIKFGPLLPGQVVLVTTHPRYRSVIDLSPSQPPPQALNPFQQLLKDLISFATNNNVPPLLQGFESFFGILPPQAILYSLLQGRFTTPIPPKQEGIAPVTSHINVGIADGDLNSKIVAAITPMRKWPE